MKELTLIILFLFVALFLFAQGFRAYLQVTYFPITRNVSIMVGDSVIIPKDSKGRPLQFSTSIAAINWLSKKGWRIEPINLGSQQNPTYLMSRENTTEKELGTMFNK
jgi:hypothetical protein